MLKVPSIKQTWRQNKHETIKKTHCEKQLEKKWNNTWDNHVKEKNKIVRAIMKTYQNNPFLSCLYTYHNFILIYAHTKLEILKSTCSRCSCGKLLWNVCLVVIFSDIWKAVSIPKYDSLQWTPKYVSSYFYKFNELVRTFLLFVITLSN